MKSKEHKYDLKLHVVKFENGGYLIFNGLAEDENDVFKLTNKISEATFLNKELKEQVENILVTYKNYLYIKEENQFLKVEGIESFLLYKELK